MNESEYIKTKRHCLRDIQFLYNNKPTKFICKDSKTDCEDCRKIKNKFKKYKITLE